ncbi:hypothetical protein [Demequina rhizosphaerae]|uniref:hypothetical protein n=1 Tax=Demequina rhizosphaerae TaxID=1638985 RepID=UPI000782E9B4|nr:hypothetical protein [Demequina rhizosphaerae]
MVTIAPARSTGTSEPLITERWSRESPTRVAIIVAWAAVTAAYVVLIAIGLTHSPVDVDEGFNLTVVRNVVAAGTYSSDGLLTTGTTDDFDVRITTGPVVLLPAAALHAVGVDIVLAGRVVVSLFAFALAAGLAVLGHRTSGRWGAVVAASTPLLLDTFTFGDSPVYGPNDMLGEFPAAALITWSLVVVQRRPWLAGLLVGLALQSKLVALLSVPALLALPIASRAWTRPWRSTLALGAFAALPTLAFEFWHLFSVGWAPWLADLRALVAFAAEQGAETSYSAFKIGALAGSWFLPAPVVVIGVLAFAAFAGFALARAGSAAFAGRVGIAHLAAGALLVTMFAAQWLASTSSPPTRTRHAMIGIVVGTALILAAGVALARFSLTLLPPRAAPWAPVAGLATAGVLSIQIMTHIGAAVDYQRYGTLGEQRAYAAALATTGSESVQGPWGIIAALAVMADMRSQGLQEGTDPSIPIVIDRYPDIQRTVSPQVLAAELCGDHFPDPGVNMVSRLYVCEPLHAD